MAPRLLRISILLLAAACTGNGATVSACEAGSARSTVLFGEGARLAVDVADDDASRARGLMGVTSLAPDRGMAFVWERPVQGSFWMKDTLIPLSIAFVDGGGTIVSIQEMTPCASASCPTYEAAAPYTMAIEANAGWFDAHGIGLGDEATIREPSCR